MPVYRIRIHTTEKPSNISNIIFVILIILSEKKNTQTERSFLSTLESANLYECIKAFQDGLF